MEYAVAFFSFLSLVVIVVVCIVLFMENEKLKQESHLIMRDIVEQVNHANMYAYNFDKKQEMNIRNLDSNIQLLNDHVTTLNPGDKLCIGTTCVSEEDLRSLKKLV